MKRQTKRTLALALTGALALGMCSVGALDISMDSYYQVAKENSFIIKYNNSMSNAVREDMNDTLVPDGMGGYTSAYYTSSSLVQKKINDMQTEDANDTAPYTIGNMLASYYTASMGYQQIVANEATLKDNIGLMETMVQLGMKSQLDLLELKNTYNQLLNQKLSVESGLATLKSTLATQLCVTVDELNIAELGDFTQEQLDGMKGRLEAKNQENQAVEANNTLALLKYQASQLGNHQYSVMRQQRENTETLLRVSYRNAYADMMNKYQTYVTAKEIYDKKQADFAITQKKHELGMISDTAYAAAERQNTLDHQDVLTAALNLRTAELTMDAFNEGVWLQSGS